MSAGTWSEPQTVPPDPAWRLPLRFELFPAGFLAGRIEVPAGEKPPSPFEVELRFGPVPAPAVPGRVAPPAAPKAAPRAVVLCPVLDGRFRCAVPARSLDFRTRVVGFMPAYHWGVEVAAGQVRDLGTWALRRGASVVGRVETEGSAPLAGCRVRLAPQRAGSLPGNPSDDALVTDERLTRLTQEVGVNHRGFFRFADVSPGSYEVEASQDQLVPARVFPVEVRAGLEAEIREPLVLARPVAIEVVVEPQLDPYGERWTVRLWPWRQESGRPRGNSWEGPASTDGRWAQEGVAPGSYYLSVVTGETRWHGERVEVEAGGPPVFLRIPLVEVRGEVRLGSDPLAATLWFGGLTGNPRVRFDADEKGRFEGALPKEGTWMIEVDFGIPGVRRVPLRPVEVKRSPGRRFARVTLAIPDTVLHGEVVDEQGRPLPGAQVITAQVGAMSVGFVPSRGDFLTDAEGKFEVRGFEPGPINLRARSPGRSSGWVPVSLEEGRSPPRLRLVAAREVELRGRVSSARGPVPGALIISWPGLGGAAMADTAEAVTGPAGEFSLRLPGGVSIAELMVLAPGFALRMMRMPVSSRSPVNLTVDPAGGTLVLPKEGGLLVHGGMWLPADALLELWTNLHGPGAGDRRRIPSLEPGEYAFCEQEASVALRLGGAVPEGLCSSGSLVPFGELTLAPPAGLAPPEGADAPAGEAALVGR